MRTNLLSALPGALLVASLAIAAGCATNDSGWSGGDGPAAGTVVTRADSGSNAAGGSGGGSGNSGGGGGGSAGDDGGSAGASGGGEPTGGGSDGGTSVEGGAGGDAAACTNGSSGLLGAIPGATMAPGTACVACHASTGAKGLGISGTVYPKLGEPDLCIGVASGVQVVITDALGGKHTLDVNSSGNFLDTGATGLIPTPYKASVVSGGTSVDMIAPQTSGDCNACHTAAGASGAAGRIIGP